MYCDRQWSCSIKRCSSSRTTCSHQTRLPLLELLQTQCVIDHSSFQRNAHEQRLKMHLSSVHRSSYYAGKPSPTLVRRDGGEGVNRNHNIVVAVLVIFVIIAAIAVGGLLVKKIMFTVRNKTHKAKGQGTHFQSGSLRQHRRPGAAAFENCNEPGHSPQPDWTFVSNLRTPASSHAASMAYSQSGHSSMPPHPAYRNDGFEPIQWASTSRPASPIVMQDVPAGRSYPQGNWI